MPQDAPLDPPTPDAFLRARRTRVVVVGGGIAGLVAALEWAKVGAHVTLLERSGRLGGAVETATLDDLPVDLVADAFRWPQGPSGALIDELRLGDLVEPAVDLPVWISGVPTGAAPLPRAAVLGIPANPWADDVRPLIGWGGAWRAYLDRLRPPLTIGRAQSLGRLVRSRMGDRVVDRMVAPVTRGLYGSSPDDIDIDAAAPGLNTALTRTGSLTGAVAELLPDVGIGEAPSRGTLRGGLGVLIDALAARLGDLGAEIRLGVDARALHRPADGGWTIEHTEVDDDEPSDPLRSDVVVVAAGPAAARLLLESAGVVTDAAPSPERDVVTLVVDAPALDAAPRGRAVYPASAPDPEGAFGVVHATAEWSWLAAAAGGGRHVLRVATAADRDRTDDAVIRSAAEDAAALFAVPRLAVRAAARRTAALAPPASALGHGERLAALRGAVSTQPGIAVVGAWVSGSGLARVVDDATAEIDRQRAGVLWRADDGTASA